MITQFSRCREYSSDNQCNTKKLSNLSLELGAWGCAPWWPVFWVVLVFFAPVPHKAKVPIFLIGIGAWISAFLVSPLMGADQPSTFITVILAIIELSLILAYFILSYRALFQEMAKRRALHDSLGEEEWKRLYYCTVHGNVVYR